MDLKEFVKIAVNDVMDAVEETIKEREAENKAGTLNPKIVSSALMEIDTINFDIAVTIGSKDLTGGSGGLQVLAFSAEGAKSRETDHSTASRVQFSLGVVWPYSNVTDVRKLTRVKT